MERSSTLYMKKPTMSMRAALKQYDMPCMVSPTSWLSDEINRTNTDYSDETSAVLSSSNYTTSTHTCSSTDESVVQSLDDISHITGGGQCSSYVEKWLYNQPQSSTPRKTKSILLEKPPTDCHARRNLFTTDNNRSTTITPLPPSSERPPCIGAEITDELHNPTNDVNVQCVHVCNNESIQSDLTLFMEKPLSVLPVTSREKRCRPTLLHKLRHVRKSMHRFGDRKTLAIL